jgi:hypothetical protein
VRTKYAVRKANANVNPFGDQMNTAEQTVNLTERIKDGGNRFWPSIVKTTQTNNIQLKIIEWSEHLYTALLPRITI